MKWFAFMFPIDPLRLSLFTPEGRSWSFLQTKPQSLVECSIALQPLCLSLHDIKYIVTSGHPFIMIFLLFSSLINKSLTSFAAAAWRFTVYTLPWHTHWCATVNVHLEKKDIIWTYLSEKYNRLVLVRVLKLLRFLSEAPLYGCSQRWTFWK